MPIIQKIVYALFTLFGVVSVIFFLFTVLPGDPAQMMLGQNQSKTQIENINAKYGFDESLGKQYVLYLNDLSPLSFHSTKASDFTSLASGKYRAQSLVCTASTCLVLKFPHLRESFQKNGKSVNSVISETLSNTAILAISAISLALLFGIFLGIISAVNKGGILDNCIQVLSTLGMSVPSFFSAILFAWLFAFVLQKYTGLNMSGNLYELDDYGEQNQLVLKNLILPAVVLGIRPLAVVSQLMRNALLEIMHQDYIRTAKAKGLSNYQIIKNHALKNALNPVVTAISGWFASMLAGAVFVEYIFGWNGLGKEIVDALNALDLPIIMGAVLVIAFLFICINILVDLIHAYLDPKLKLN